MKAKNNPQNDQARFDFVCEAEQKAVEKIMRERGCCRDAAIRLLEAGPKHTPTEPPFKPLPEKD